MLRTFHLKFSTLTDRLTSTRVYDLRKPCLSTFLSVHSLPSESRVGFIFHRRTDGPQRLQPKTKIVAAKIVLRHGTSPSASASTRTQDPSPVDVRPRKQGLRRPRPLIIYHLIRLCASKLAAWDGVDGRVFSALTGLHMHGLRKPAAPVPSKVPAFAPPLPLPSESRVASPTPTDRRLQTKTKIVAARNTSNKARTSASTRT